MFAAPAEGTLKHFMEFAETGFADHEQSPPNQRTHATEHYATLINRNRRYGRFRHASSLPKPTRTPSNLTPGISRSRTTKPPHPSAGDIRMSTIASKLSLNEPLTHSTRRCHLWNA